eukprot:TRINITY_DN3527_c0_g1_i1.p1 TRINITY_DN3527_c0_g1~~TRINITY_DN3527_c0_g1_i1.p1  ORF type:complete len:156 (-),score=34.07 TRINITY_DN3527_c0_g1_i1:69-536(-)
MSLPLLFVTLLFGVAHAQENATCTCILNFCKCCEPIQRSFPLIGEFKVDTCVGVAMRLDQNRMDVVLLVNGHEIVGKNFTASGPGEPLCAPFELGLDLCIEVQNQEVDIIHRTFKGCPVVTGLYLDVQLFKAPFNCFELNLSKDNSASRKRIDSY